jgi:hypothetical protein
MVNDGVWCFMMVYDGLRGYNEDIYIYTYLHIYNYIHTVSIYTKIYSEPIDLERFPHLFHKFRD